MESHEEDREDVGWIQQALDRDRTRDSMRF